MARKIFFLLILLFICGSTVLAQNNQNAFSSLRAGISYQKNISNNNLQDYWKAEPTVNLFLETPFYAGDFLISGKYGSFSNLDNDLPDFDNLQVGIGWALRHQVLSKIKIGVSTGILFSIMKFKNVSDEHQERAEKRFGSTSPESEIGFSLGADIQYNISPMWGIKMQWNRDVIYTRHKIIQDYWGIGIYHEMKMPKWLREILK